MMNKNLQDAIELAFSKVPNGVIVKYSIDKGLVDWTITEKPIDFSQEAEHELLNQLKTATLSASTSSFISSELTDLYDADIAYAVLDNATVKIALRKQ